MTKDGHRGGVVEVSWQVFKLPSLKVRKCKSLKQRFASVSSWMFDIGRLGDWQ
jgi:hypothetical protein